MKDTKSLTSGVYLIRGVTRLLFFVTPSFRCSVGSLVTFRANRPFSRCSPAWTIASVFKYNGKRHVSAYFRGYMGDYILSSPESGLLFLVDKNGVECLDCSSKYHQKKCRKLAYSSDKRGSLTQLGAIIISSVRLVLGLCGLMLKRTSP